MDENISIRKAEPGDIKDIKHILFSALKEYEIAVPDGYSVSDIDSIEGRSRGVQVFVLQQNHSVIGFTVLRPIDKDCVELKRLYLTAPARGKKLGAYLLKFAVGLAEQNHYKTMKLETTSKFRDAVFLYKKFGFKESDGKDKTAGHDLAFELALLP